ncbi:sugar phosphate isomerase/epimerase family protein [Lysinibacter cavernae]|uniref:Sugar phosphate isomerase/epimerase n=1 Tax=Lysinibacter cavernae TaxID=1640652 RepID=A0A7X5R272_9MICO|nr:sugar phosphate isomerase/epimerase [Lysinibacter cavernae]NIH54132.1 sugar phosphate isomerase/epimerase [Lysinibacter cavernae]
MVQPVTSLQLYTLREALEHDLAATIARVAEIGFTAVEPYRFVDRADEFAAALTQHSLNAPSGHAPLLSENQNDIFEAAAKLGIGTVIDPFVPEEQWTTRSGIEQIAAGLNAAAAVGATHGISVGYHNHWWEVETIVDDRRSIEVLTDFLDPSVVLEIDTYWAQVAGADVPQLLRDLGSRVTFIHIKDGPATREPKDQVALGQGVLPLHEILAAAGSLTAQVVELDDTRGDMFTAVADSYAYLNQIGVK